MKRIVLMALLALALPLSAFASSSVDLGNNGGALSGSSAGLTLSASTLITLANGTHNYTLTGSLTGIWTDGSTVNGATVQLTINTGRGFFNGETLISSGDTNISTAAVPEPGTLGLLGTGLVAVAGALRRKLKS